MISGDRLTLSATQVEAAAPANSNRLAYVWCYNANTAVVYLNVWASAPGASDRAASARAGGPWPIGPGQSVPVLCGTQHAGAVRLSATTGTDATGSPSIDVQAVPTWEG